MDTIIVYGWVCSGNRWLARLLAYYGDGQESLDAEAFYLEHYWFRQADVRYFGADVRIQTGGHKPPSGLPGEGERWVYVIRDPRDAFASWYRLLMRVDNGVWDAQSRTWKSYLPWLVEQDECNFRQHAEQWLALEEERPPRVSWARHESLYAHREEGLLRLVGEMGYPRDRKRSACAARLSEHEPHRPNVWKQPRPGEPGEWRRVYDIGDARFVDRHYGDLIERLGYGREPEWLALLGKDRS